MRHGLVPHLKRPHHPTHIYDEAIFCLSTLFAIPISNRVINGGNWSIV